PRHSPPPPPPHSTPHTHSSPTRRSSDLGDNEDAVRHRRRLPRELERRLLAQHAQKVLERPAARARGGAEALGDRQMAAERFRAADRKSTRLNSSHRTISYAVVCLKKKRK